MSVIVERGPWVSTGKGNTRRGPAQQKPISRHGIAQLQLVAVAPVPRQTVNSGLAQKLVAEGMVEIVRLPSPFRIHDGGNIEHLQLTERGRRFLERAK